MINKDLVEFIKNAMIKGYSEQFIIDGLKSKNWPIEVISDSLKAAKNELSEKQTNIHSLEPIRSKTDDSIIKEKSHLKYQDIQEEHGFRLRSILPGFTVIIGLFLLFSFTILVTFYMFALMDYRVVIDGIEYSKFCIQEDCSDLRAFAVSNVKNNFLYSLSVALITSVLIVRIYKILPSKFRIRYFWFVIGIYFIALMTLALIWTIFSAS